MFSSENVNYLGNEIKYGAKLYVSGWKKLLLHPLQTIKDTTYAVFHPIQTTTILFNELRQHPIGMATNFALSWITGRFSSSSLQYLKTTNINNSIVDFSKSLQNSTSIPEPAIAAISQVAQLSTKVIGRGCCSGICTTTAARLSQTTSLIASQSLSANQEPALQSMHQESRRDFVPHFDMRRNSGNDDNQLEQTASLSKKSSNLRNKSKK